MSILVHLVDDRAAEEYTTFSDTVAWCRMLWVACAAHFDLLKKQ